MARLGGTGEGAESLIEDLYPGTTDRDDIVEANRLRGYAWLLLMVILGPGATIIWLGARMAEIRILQALFGVVIFIGLGVGAISFPHLCRMAMADLVLAKTGGRKSDSRRMRWAMPKVRDFYVGLVFSVILVGFFGIGGLWEWVMS
jgi:hypothetical protein